MSDPHIGGAVDGAVKGMVERAVDGTSLDLTYKACEALWRDVKYAVMARNYRYVKELSTQLLRARGDILALKHWIQDIKCIEKRPIAESALKNTAYHLLGYWKRDMTDIERQEMSQLIAKDATSAIHQLRLRLPTLENSYLETSYIWRCEAWTEVNFRAGRRSYRARFDSTDASWSGDPASVVIEITEC